MSVIVGSPLFFYFGNARLYLPGFLIPGPSINFLILEQIFYLLQGRQAAPQTQCS